MAVNKALIIAVAAIAVLAAGGTAAFIILHEDQYPIEYELNGGEFCGDHPQTYRSGEKIDLEYPVKDEKAFAGWYTDADMTVHFNGDTAGIEGPLKLYARWTASPLEYRVWLEVHEECDRGFSSYVMEGTRATYFDLISNRSGLMHTVIVDMVYYDYIDHDGEGMSKIIRDESWNAGFGDYGYTGIETIDTIDGPTVCEVYSLTHDDGATDTLWLNGDGLVCKQCYEYIGDDDSDTKRKIATRTLSSYLKSKITDVYSVEVYSGLGIDVTGNKESYLPGELVTLEAVPEPGTTFSGWYDSNLKLLCEDRKYVFEVGQDQRIYALNSLDEVYHFKAGDLINFSKIFNNAERYTWYTSYKEGDIFGDSWQFSEHVIEETGFYIIAADTPKGDRMAVLMQIGGNVHRDYEWKWDGKTYTVGLDIGFDDYYYAKNLYDLGERRQDKPDHIRDKTFVTYGYEDEVMKKYTAVLVDKLIDAYKEKNSTITQKDYINYLLAFTQYIPYQTDEEFLGYKEYWKFPLETLYDKSGDCEDTSILFVLLAHESRAKLGFDYDVGLQIMPGHACVAVKTSAVSAKNNPYGYVYGETTALNYNIGDIPEKMKDYFIDESYYPPISSKSFLVEIE